MAIVSYTKCIPRNDIGSYFGLHFTEPQGLRLMVDVSVMAAAAATSHFRVSQSST